MSAPVPTTAWPSTRRTGILLACTALAARSACGGGRDRPKADLAAAQISTIGVNSYLWRAALDAVSFAPLLQVDSAGGVIVTDWYANPANPEERVKMSVTILDQDLRADALRVAASRQVMQARSEEHTSELQSLMRISYAVFCLKK